MLTRRLSFLAPLAALFGLAPAAPRASGDPHPDDTAPERMAKLGLNPGDVRLTMFWVGRDDGSGKFDLAMYLDCHGETYGKLIRTERTDPTPGGAFVVSADGVRRRLEGIGVQTEPLDYAAIRAAKNSARESLD